MGILGIWGGGVWDFGMEKFGNLGWGNLGFWDGNPKERGFLGGKISQNPGVRDGNLPKFREFGVWISQGIWDREFGVGIPPKFWEFRIPPEVEGALALPEAAAGHDADPGLLQEPHAEEHVRGLVLLLGIRDRERVGKMGIPSQNGPGDPGVDPG